MLCKASALGRRVRWTLSCLAILALLATSLGSIVTPTFAAWNPAHGHLSGSDVASDHSHPWDEVAASNLATPAIDPDDYCSLHGIPHPIAPTAAPDESPPAEDEPSIVFTMGADGTVASVGTPALPAIDSVQMPAPALVALANADRVREPASVAQQTPVPPPRI